METVWEILPFAEHQALFFSERYGCAYPSLCLSGEKIRLKKHPWNRCTPDNHCNYRQYAATGIENHRFSEKRCYFAAWFRWIAVHWDTWTIVCWAGSSFGYQNRTTRGCVISLWRTLFLCVSIYSSWIVVFLHKGNLIILYRNFTFLVLSITKQPQSSQKGIIVPDGKTVQIEFYRFIPKYFFKLNPIPNNPMSM